MRNPIFPSEVICIRDIFKRIELRPGSTVITLLLFSAFTVNSYGQRIAQSGTIEDNTTQQAASSGVTVWSVPAEQKVRPDSRVETRNLVWSAESKTITVAGAGNEHVPFQVILTTSVSGSSRNVKAPDGFEIEASELTSQKGEKISNEHISFYLQHFIFLDGVSSPVGATGYWPDALAPLKAPFSMVAQYNVVQNRPLWVDLFIPSGTRSGTYSGTITVTQHESPVETLKIQVEVYNFSLPDETPLITYMNVSRSGLADFYDKPAQSEEIDKLTQKYYEFLYTHRMEPWFNDMLTPEAEAKDGRVQVKFNDERYRYYMNVLKTKRVLLNAYPGNMRRQIRGEQFSPEFNKIILSYLSQVKSYFEKNGWKDRLVFNSPIDEPRSLEEYENTRKWAALVKEATTDVPFLVTRTPVPPKNNPEWGTFRGYVSNYSMHGNQMNDPELKRVILEEKARGGELTWYISCDQKYPQPNYFIDAPALDLVMVPWITARYDIDGILYWALNHWNETPNPWHDASTFHSGFICSGGWVLNGEGSLLYPGDFTQQYTGQPNVDGPVSSLRFELLREGIEDYVYLSMLEKLGDKEFADNQVRDLVVDVRAFSRNLDQLYLTRRAMARRLEELNR
jgi:hypothetical protein